MVSGALVEVAREGAPRGWFVAPMQVACKVRPAAKEARRGDAQVSGL